MANYNLASFGKMNAKPKVLSSQSTNSLGVKNTASSSSLPVLTDSNSLGIKDTTSNHALLSSPLSDSSCFETASETNPTNMEACDILGAGVNYSVPVGRVSKRSRAPENTANKVARHSEGFVNVKHELARKKATKTTIEDLVILSDDSDSTFVSASEKSCSSDGSNSSFEEENSPELFSSDEKGSSSERLSVQENCISSSEENCTSPSKDSCIRPSQDIFLSSSQGLQVLNDAEIDQNQQNETGDNILMELQSAPCLKSAERPPVNKSSLEAVPMEVVPSNLFEKTSLEVVPMEVVTSNLLDASIKRPLPSLQPSEDTEAAETSVSNIYAYFTLAFLFKNLKSA